MNNKKIFWGNIFTSLIIWLLSNFTILLLVLLGAGDQNLSPEKRVIFAVTSFISDMSDGKYFAETRKVMADESQKVQSRNLRQELESQKQKLESFVANISSLSRLAVLLKYENDIQNAFAQYAQASKMLTDSGENCDDPKVKEAIETLTSLNSYINDEFTRQYAARDDMSARQRGEILSKCLLNTAQGFEIAIDSIGIGNDMYGNKKSLIINGYWQFDPEKIQIKPDFFMTELGFKKQDDSSGNDMLICFVNSEDKKDYDIYYGKKADFDLKNLKTWYVFDNHQGMNVEVTFSGIHHVNIPCSRLSSWSSPKYEMLVVDMRPQKWCKFAVSQELSGNILLQLETHPEFVITPVKFNESFASGKVSGSHLTPASYLHQDLAADTAAVAVPQRIALNKFFGKDAADNNSREKTASPDDSSNRSATAQENEAADYNEEGRELERKGKYQEAFQAFSKAAGLGSEAGKFNCALLLVNGHCRWVNRQQQNISYVEARHLLLELVASSKNRNVLSNSYNALGYIYMRGGFGVRADYAKAEKYFQIAIKYGSSLAEGNLKQLKQFYR